MIGRDSVRPRSNAVWLVNVRGVVSKPINATLNIKVLPILGGNKVTCSTSVILRELFAGEVRDCFVVRSSFKSSQVFNPPITIKPIPPARVKPK